MIRYASRQAPQSKTSYSFHVELLVFLLVFELHHAGFWWSFYFKINVQYMFSCLIDCFIQHFFDLFEGIAKVGKAQALVGKFAYA